MTIRNAIITYLIDCKGYDEDTATDIARDYDENIAQVLNIREMVELEDYTGVTL